MAAVTELSVLFKNLSVKEVYMEKIVTYISTIESKQIVLLRETSVIQWLLGDTSFLPLAEKKNKSKDTEALKLLEDKWGQDILKKRRPDLKLDKQWTNKFGEHICEELCILQNKVPIKPKAINHYQPDLEVEDYICEAKAQTYFTTGTAGEKILGTAFKYAEIPRLYNKPLKIICIGGAEKCCREQYGNLEGKQTSDEKKAFLEFYKSMNIIYVGASDILKGLVQTD
jgi:hypothetical protein